MSPWRSIAGSRRTGRRCAVAGGIWVGAALRKRQRELAEFQQELTDDTNRRLAELENRLEFAERLLQRGASDEPPG